MPGTAYGEAALSLYKAFAEAKELALNEQGLLERDFALEEAFAPSTLDVFRL